MVTERYSAGCHHQQKTGNIHVHGSCYRIAIGQNTRLGRYLRNDKRQIGGLREYLSHVQEGVFRIFSGHFISRASSSAWHGATHWAELYLYRFGRFPTVTNIATGLDRDENGWKQGGVGMNSVEI